MATSSLEQKLEPWFTNEVMIVQPLASLTVTWFVYGFYLALFILALHNLHKYSRKNQQLYLTWTVLLFFLCTLNNVFETWYRVRQAIKIYTGEHTKDYPTLATYAQHDSIKTIQRGFLMILPIFANLVAESMLIHRCYVVWFGNKWVGITLLVVSVILNSIGLAGCIMFTVGFRDTRFPEHVALLLRGNNINNGYLIANVVFNSLLTVLTAGRIYIISREAKKYLDESISRTYNTVVAVIIESGILYPTALIIYIVILITQDPDNQSLLPVDLSPLFMQAAGIAPTLIIVRALQGKTTDSVNQVVSANNPNNRNGTTTTTMRSRIQFAHGNTVTSTIDNTATHHAVDLLDGHSASGTSTGYSEKVESQNRKGEEV